jgi:hypothetical protein
MLDPLFSFVDPIVEPIEDEGNVFHFVAIFAQRTGKVKQV